MPTWNNVKVGSFLTERKNRFKPDEANELGLKRLYKIDFSGNIHLLDDKQTNTGMILVKKGDLVISGINVEKGAISVYQGDEDVLATIHYSSYNFDKSQIDIEYFKWFLKSQTFKSVMQSQVRGGIKTELKPKNFLPLKIDLPDLPTQKVIRERINNVSGEIKEVSGLNIKNENYVNKLRQSILQEAVQGKLVPQDPNDEPASVLLKKIKLEKDSAHIKKKIDKNYNCSECYNIPRSWLWTKFSEIIIYGPRNGQSTKPTKEKTPFKCLTLTATTSGKFNGSHYKYVNGPISADSHLWLKKDDLLLQRGNSIEYVGMASLYDGNDDEFIYPDLMIKVRMSSKVSARYIHYFLISPYARNYFMGNASGTAGTMPKINQGVILSLNVPLPPLNEQKRIVEKVDQLMKLCDELGVKVKENQKNTDLLMGAVLREAFEVKESG